MSEMVRYTNGLPFLLLSFLSITINEPSQIFRTINTYRQISFLNGITQILIVFSTCGIGLINVCTYERTNVTIPIGNPSTNI